MTSGRRAFAFAVVGAAGLVVQLAAFAALTRAAGLPYALASVLAVELAVVHNFAWHERWTWADRPAASLCDRLARLSGFHLSNGAVSIVGTLGFTIAFVEAAGLPPALANLTAVAATGALNFLASDQLVFARRPVRPARGLTCHAKNDRAA